MGWIRDNLTYLAAGMLGGFVYSVAAPILTAGAKAAIRRVANTQKKPKKKKAPKAPEMPSSEEVIEMARS